MGRSESHDVLRAAQDGAEAGEEAGRREGRRGSGQQRAAQRAQARTLCSERTDSEHPTLRGLVGQSRKETEKQRVRKAVPGADARTRKAGRRAGQAKEETSRRKRVLRELRGGLEAAMRCDRTAAREATRVRPPTPPT